MAPKISDEDFDKLLKEALPVIDAMDAPPSPPPPEILQRLEADRLKLVEESKPRISAEAPKTNSLIEFFQWLLSGPRLLPVSIACSALLVLGVIIFKLGIFSLPTPTLQLAMLDTVGATRGTASSVVAVLQGASKAQVQQFSASAELKRWMETWPADDQQPVVKIVYDLDEGQLLVAGRGKGKRSFEKTFPVQQVQDLPAVLKAAQAFIGEQIR